MSGSNWLKTWFCAVFITVLVVGVFNYRVDSFGLVTMDGYLDKAAVDLAHGKIIAGLRNFDDRVFQKKVIQNIERKIDWVVIGSSRSMQLRETMISGSAGVFQNYSVTGASLEDYLALLSIHLDKHGQLPENLVLGIDPWVFNKNSAQNRYQSISEDYQAMLERLGVHASEKIRKPSYISKLFSIEYMVQNFKFIKNNINNGLKGYRIVKSSDIDAHLREADGSIRYGYSKRFPNYEDVKRYAISYTKGSGHSLGQFEELSNAELFEKFVVFLKENNVRVYCYLPPYNPYAYDVLMQDPKYRIINSVENYLRALSQQHDLVFVGSYDPYILGFTNEDFFDGAHSLDRVCEKLFKNVGLYDRNEVL